MENLKEYDIRFIGLKVGKHNYSFKVGKQFFDAFEHSQIEDGNIDVEMELEKSTNMLVLQFSISGLVKSECDICLDPLDVSIQGDYRQIIKIADEEDSDDEEISFIGTGEISIDVAPFIFEFIHLSLPFKKVHPEGECNEGTQEVLNQYILVDEDQAEESDEIDPRWEALKKLKKD